MFSVGKNRNSTDKDVDRIIENAYNQLEEACADNDADDGTVSRMVGQLVGVLNTLCYMGYIDVAKHDYYIFKAIMLL